MPEPFHLLIVVYFDSRPDYFWIPAAQLDHEELNDLRLAHEDYTEHEAFDRVMKIIKDKNINPSYDCQPRVDRAIQELCIVRCLD